MSQVFITMGKPPSRDNNSEAQAFSAHNANTEEITSSGTSQATTITADNNGDVARVVNNGTDTIWAEFGSDPTAAVETTHPVPGNTTFDYRDLRAGDKVAIINDS